MAFGIQGNASAEEVRALYTNKGSSSSAKKFDKPKERLYPNARLRVMEGEPKNIIFLDDVCEYTPEQVAALNILGITIGPFYALEHRSQLTNPFTSKRTWSNWHSCSTGYTVDYEQRVLVSHAMGLFSNLVRETLDYDLWTKLAMGPKWSKDLLEELCSEKQIDYGSELFNLPVNKGWKCVPCEIAALHKLGKDGKPLLDQQGRPLPKFPVGRGTVTIFRTVIDLSTSEWKGVTYENTLKVFSLGQAAAVPYTQASDALNPFAGKHRKGLSRYGMTLTVPGPKKSPLPGMINAEYSLEQIQELNPNAVIQLTESKIREILEADSNMRMYAHFASTGEQVSIDEMTQRLVRILCSDGSQLYPYPLEYTRQLLPKTPTYMGKVFNEYVETSLSPGVLREARLPNNLAAETKTDIEDDEIPF